jgi:chromate transporter
MADVRCQKSLNSEERRGLIMLIYWHIFLAFFIPGIVGYGGGPPSIPLVEHEVVDRYHWLTREEFADVVAMGNALPGPIATKMAGYIGYEVGGWMGATVGLFATVAPSLIIMLGLVSWLYRHKESPRVKRMSSWVKPTIAVLLAILAYEFLAEAFVNTTLGGIGWLQTLAIAVISYLLLEIRKVHPALVIALTLGYGAVFLS